MTRGRAIRIVAAIAVVVVSASAYLAYRLDLRRAHERIAAGSHIGETPCGPVEYETAGDGGPAVLAIHGAGGGYDQGLDLADVLIQRGFRVVAPSRFGYLGTPLPVDPSAEAQADAYACLLDALRIPHAVVIGASAGGPSAMQFALRHPRRVDALILLVPAAYPAAAATRLSPVTQWMTNAMLRSDFLFWLAMRVAHRPLIRVVLGTPLEVYEQASAADRGRLELLLDHMLPISSRRQGLVQDAAIVSALPRYDLERIATPTLIVSAKDDGYRTYEGAHYSAEHIPGARFLGYEHGGHLLVGHQQDIFAEIEALLTRVTAR
jgi:pimeloyl-ACP methyl ester carboxylesterase